MVEKFTSKFQAQAYKEFAPLIEDFNKIVTNPTFVDKLEGSLNIMQRDGLFLKEDVRKLGESIKTEFLPIILLSN